MNFLVRGFKSNYAQITLKYMMSKIAFIFMESIYLSRQAKISRVLLG